MSALQKINLGTPPKGEDGDDVRTAFTRMNANVDVLNAQAALTSAVQITAAQALTAAHIGKRVNISLAAAGVITLPAANVGAADNVVLLRNIGTAVVTLAITAGSGDSLALSKLNPGEAALLDTDGVHAWSVLMRGRTNADNEVINGSLTIGTPLALASGGTGGNSAAAARANLGVGMTLLGSATPSNGAGVVFTGLSGYNVYELVFDGVVPSVDNQSLALNFSNNNGSSYLSSSQYQRALMYQSVAAPAVTTAGQSTNTALILWDGMSSVAGSPTFATYSGRVRFHNFSDGAKIPSAIVDVIGVDRSNNAMGQVRGVGQYLGLTGLPINAIQVYAGSSGFSAGRFSIYGLSK
ncbi:hypothetical protein [Paraburkholderia sp. J41]|uniref:hypothetical protein n=1 Tax=Paraburkholderia sp. J41 TaxID=2805433 RepID=UPI002AC3151F|nr:hypothetical protein [Paraburkholderia sp. J41]